MHWIPHLACIRWQYGPKIAGLLGPQDSVYCYSARQIDFFVQCTRACTSQRLQKKHYRQCERLHRSVCVGSSFAHARVHIREHVYTARMGACTRSRTRAVRSHSESMHMCISVHDRGHALVHARAQKAYMNPFCSCASMHACMHTVNAHGMHDSVNQASS
jgi:hypothetical protein